MFKIVFVFLFPLLAYANPYKASFSSASSTIELQGDYPAVAQIPITLDRPATELIVNVEVTVIDSSAQSGVHYTIPYATAVVPQGSNTGSIVIQGLPNPDATGIKKLNIHIKGSGTITPSGTTKHQVVLKYSKTIKVQVQPQSVLTEADEDYTHEIRFELSEPYEKDITVMLSVQSGGTAFEGSDYALLKTAVTIKAGSTLTYLPLIILGDDKEEKEEVVSWSLSLLQSFEDVSLAVQSYTLTILDDDKHELIIDDVTVIESVGQAKVRISLTNPLRMDFKFAVGTRSGFAKRGEDYNAPDETILEIKEGDTETFFYVDIIDDKTTEVNEFFYVYVVEDYLPDEVEIEFGEGTVTIKDNETRDFLMETLFLVHGDQDDAAFEQAEFIVDGEIKRNGPYKYKTNEMFGTVLFSPDRVDVSGSASARIKELSFTKSWKVKKLAIDLYNFPITRIPGIHLFLQMFCPLRMMNGDQCLNPGDGKITWVVNPSNITLKTTGKDVHLEILVNSSYETLSEQTKVMIRLRK